MKQKNSDANRIFNMKNAREMVDSFAFSCSVSCRLYDQDGRLVYEQNLDEDLWQICVTVMGNDDDSPEIHMQGAQEAARLGGRYIYMDSLGMAWLTSPILLEGKIAGSLYAGPLMMMELDDYIASTPFCQKEMTLERLDALYHSLRNFPHRSPQELNYLSMQLLAAALYIGDSSLAIWEMQEQEQQHSDISDYLQQYKLQETSEAYPRDKEIALIQAIRDGDQKDARRLLNELLGYIFFATGGHFHSMRTRSLELMALLSRAAADGGADLQQVLAMNEKFLMESDHHRSVDDLIGWLTSLVNRYTSLVFDMVDVERKDIMYKAINYMKQNLGGHLTLESTASHVGFSPTYFSKVFKEEMGVTFNHYLSQLRIERSKSLLLSEKMSVREVCDAVGYDDQSYFIKVFSKFTGVTPGNYRRKQGRLDSTKERASSQNMTKNDLKENGS